jgi:hypothetical protein
MSEALNTIGQAVDRIEASTRGVRIALAFGIVAAGYGLIVAGGVIG